MDRKCPTSRCMLAGVMRVAKRKFAATGRPERVFQAGAGGHRAGANRDRTMILMRTPNGKIGRLPRELREQVNQRLADNEPSRPLLAWLNSLPAVQAILAAGFGGKPINQPNLNHWRTGGFRQWLYRQEACAFTRQLTQDWSHPVE